ncbi:major capsid protein E [Rhizobium rhizosphaerae]|uniref:Major capsid protein E n=1 Tax=Xaviernesmea rhizosphaerae TaxID=1672749 RepID=A0A1Q9ANB0_9HYPH|nr:major capsid protein [Xaviernesmea rhizosphaerae]OLP56819.1 major capsid protein E [Xaviernesmea rhizosphaerae]
MPEILLPYTDVEMTEEVNRIPNTYGLLNALNIAPSERKGSRYVRIGYRDGQIYVLAQAPRGAPGDVGPNDSENSIILEIPHFPHIDFIAPDDIDGLLEIVNGQVTPASLDRELGRKLAKIRVKHAITREYIRLGMLKGLIKDGKGRTLYDLYDVFGISKKVVDLQLGTATNLMDKCEEIRDHVQTNLKGETSDGIEVITSPTLFSRLVSHPNAEKFWLNAQNANYQSQIGRSNLGNNWGRLFLFGDILWREYKGSLPVKTASGEIVSEPNVAAGKGHAYPTGTQNTMRTYDGPAFHIDLVNRPIEGEEPILITTKQLDHGAGYEIKSQSNFLAVNKRPETQVEIITSN